MQKNKQCNGMVWLLLCLLMVGVQRSEVSASGSIEIAFSFDTTGSMSSVIRQVRSYVVQMVQRLQSDIPGIRIAIFAHGDYGDAYVTKHLDFTTDVKKIKKFVEETGSTGGGDSEEAYERVLHEILNKLSWTNGTSKSVMMIGDEIPHKVTDRRNKKRIDWREESRKMKERDIRIYAIQALHVARADTFYEGMANLTDGYRLRLTDFSNVFDFIMAISYREYGLEFLKAYEEEVKKRPGGISNELQKLFDDLKSKPDRAISHAAVTTPNPLEGSGEIPEVDIIEEPFDASKTPEIYYLHISSDIRYRFATTTIESRLANKAVESREAIFNVRLPQAAFISNFSMIIDGIEYPGDVKEKEKAKKIYIKAKSEGKTAGHVAAKPRNTNSFKVSINVEAGKKITFKLIYQELLQRKLGLYEHPIYIDPGQAVRDLKINVTIRESREITVLKVPPIREDESNVLVLQQDNPLAVITRPASNVATILYNPSLEQQSLVSSRGVKGQFLVQYDVIRDLDAGDIQVNNGYFVHYFAPAYLEPTNKNLVFVLDTSGSMSGQKMKQLQDAMDIILSDLREGDSFNIISFSSFSFFWQKDLMVPVNDDTIRDAKKWVKERVAAGGTNINSAVLKGVSFLEKLEDNGLTTMIFFLTDGEPTSGVQNVGQILENIGNANRNRFNVFSLGFGDDINYPFLKKLSLQNKGIARRIYADSDASLQLQGFYQEVASPLLTDVQFNYINAENDSLTHNSFDTYFKGSEIVIAGKLTSEEQNLISKINAYGKERNVYDWNVIAPSHGGDSLTFDDDALSAEGLGDFTERMWAYLTIKNILDKRVESENATEKEVLKQEALKLSLKYHFVTPLTSMVVVKPDEPEKETVGDEKNKDDEEECCDKETDPIDKTLESIDKSRKASEDYDYDAPVRRPSASGRGGGRGFADHDPHFVIKIGGSLHPICFDVMGDAGDIYQLLHDPKQGITVNTRFVGDINFNSNGKKLFKTYFGDIAVIMNDLEALISPHGLVINQAKYDWKSDHHLIIEGGINITIKRKKNMTISTGNGLKLLIVRHKTSNVMKEDYLGFYILDGTPLSLQSHGLLGQFEKSKIKLKFANDEPLSPKIHFMQSNHRDPVTAHAGKRRNSINNDKVPCWFVQNNGRGLLEGSHKDYVLPKLRYRQLAPGIRELRRKRKHIVPWVRGLKSKRRYLAI